uniref:EB domain-containing protein n=1 Tax=Clastoptera arizonana TaxID=38151 RepID=A0A1B6D9A5_9HEMI
MKRRWLTVWLVLLVAAHGARTADPQDVSTLPSEPRGNKKFGDRCEETHECGFDNSICDKQKKLCQCLPEYPVTNHIDKCESEPRGDKKFGDRCEETQECGFDNSVCDKQKKSCQCLPEYPATNHIDKCGPEVRINESCFFNEQCEIFLDQAECKDGRCVCRFELNAMENKNTGKWTCTAPLESTGPEKYIDPTMIAILVVMALMFVIICVVLHLFSKARWRENRSIFNTPNPRLMNVSLLRENKHPGERRGSVRAPSRQPSMASLRPQSPNASQAVA